MRDTSPCYRYGVVVDGELNQERQPYRSLESAQTQRPLEDVCEAEIAEGIFEVRIQPLDRPHLRIGDVLHCERNPLFTFSKRRDGMPELVPVENYHIAGFSDQLKMARLLGGMVFEKLAHQLTLR